MMRNYFGFILIFLIFSISCSKKTYGPEVETDVSPAPKYYRTIVPAPYLPVYPGSTWKYLNDKKDTIYNGTSLTYVKDSYSYTQQGVNYLSDTVLVPIYNGIPIWGYKMRNGNISQTPGGNPFNYVVSDSLAIGYTWTQSYDPNTKIYTNARIENKNYTLQVGSKTYSPTIVIVYQNSPSIGQVTQPIKRRFYTRDIGFVREELLSTTSGSVVGSLTLHSYNINK